MESLVFHDYASTDPLDFYYILGNAAPGSSSDVILRIGNTSDTYQAEDVKVSIKKQYSWQSLWLSVDGDAFFASIEIGDIPPDSLSPPFWLRRVTASSDGDGTRFAILDAKPSAWTTSAATGTSDNVGLSTPDNPPSE